MGVADFIPCVPHEGVHLAAHAALSQCVATVPCSCRMALYLRVCVYEYAYVCVCGGGIYWLAALSLSLVTATVVV